MAPEFLTLLDTKIASLPRLSLTLHFLFHPDRMETIDSLARANGYDTSFAGKQLTEMTQDGVLMETQIDGVTFYRLTMDRPLRRLLQQFHHAYGDFSFRIEVIICLISNREACRAVGADEELEYPRTVMGAPARHVQVRD